MNIQINTEFDETIAAKVFENKHPSLNRGVLIIAPAMGVVKSFYRHIAAYFSKNGFNVLSFDYLGIGDSSKVNDHKKCTLRNWGFRDLATVIDYCSQRFTDQSIYLLGHSISGQVFPFAKNKNKIKSAYFVASQNVSQLNWSGWHRLKVYLFWYFILPVFNTLFKGLPGFAFGGNQKIPQKVASEWRAWGTSKSVAPGNVPNGEKLYDEVKVPVKFLSFEDDHMLAPKKATSKLYASYGSTKKIHQHIKPRDLGLKQIGHFGFFRKTSEPLWDDIDQWFLETS